MARISNKAAGKAQDRGIAYAVKAFTVFETTLYAACRAIEAAEFEADCKRQQITALVKAEYGAVSPTFTQYRELQEAMQLQSLADGFTGQAMRKHVAAAVNGLYGSLPVSDSPAAQLKAKARAIKAAVAKKAAPSPDVGGDTLAGNVAGGAMPHRAGPAESIEQFIARVGITATINALARILEADNATKIDALTLRTIAGHVNAPKAGALKLAA